MPMSAGIRASSLTFPNPFVGNSLNRRTALSRSSSMHPNTPAHALLRFRLSGITVTHLYRIAVPVPDSTTSVLSTVPLRLLAGHGFLGLRALMCSTALQRSGKLFRRGVRDAEVLALVAERLSVTGIRRASMWRVGGGRLHLISCLPAS